MERKRLETLVTTSIDEVIDALSLFYVWNVRGRKEEIGQVGYPFENLDFFDLFYQVNMHHQKAKIPKVFLESFMHYVESQEENIRIILFDEDVDLHNQAVTNLAFSIEMFLLAKFYYKAEIDEEKLIELSENFKDFDSYIEEHFWGNVGCDMKNSIMFYSN